MYHLLSAAVRLSAAGLFVAGCAPAQEAPGRPEFEAEASSVPTPTRRPLRMRLGPASALDYRESSAAGGARV